MTAKQLATAIANELTAKRGLDIRILDLRDMRSFTDYFVIASASSDRHAQTLADAATTAAKHLGEQPLGIEGQQIGRWILIDLGEVVVHVFQREAREFYGIERLWGDAESLALPIAAGESA